MADEQEQDQNTQGSGEVQQNPVKDTEDWATGDEPITGAQLSYLNTLATEAGESTEGFDQMTKAQASEKIEALQGSTNRQGDDTPT